MTVDVPKLPEASHLEPEEGVIASFLDNSRWLFLGSVYIVVAIALKLLLRSFPCLLADSSQL